MYTENLLDHFSKKQNIYVKTMNQYIQTITSGIDDEEFQLLTKSQELQVTNNNCSETKDLLKHLVLKKKEANSFYLNAYDVIKETENLEKLLQFTTKTSINTENSNIVDIHIIFCEGRAHLKLLFGIEYGAFALTEMKPRHKNYEILEKFFEESQDIQELLHQSSLYFNKIFKENAEVKR